MLRIGATKQYRLLDFLTIMLFWFSAAGGPQTNNSIWCGTTGPVATTPTQYKIVVGDLRIKAEVIPLSSMSYLLIYQL